MVHVVSPGSMHSGGDYSGGSRPFFFVRIVADYGRRGAMALAVAALVAFTPLGLLAWFNDSYLAAALTKSADGPIRAREYCLASDRQTAAPSDESSPNDDRAGEIGIVCITCDTPSVDGWRELLRDDDPARPRDLLSAGYVRHESVYIRRVGWSWAPFALVGRPPVNVWLPAGDYEVLVVHQTPRAEPRIDARSHSFPLISVRENCSATAGSKTECRVRLPHYDWGPGEAPLVLGADGVAADRSPNSAELSLLAVELSTLSATPTPGGLALSLPEPRLQHSDDHRGCAADFAQLETTPREWTREQIATVRNWLPDDAAAARARLSALVDSLEWRETLQGWFAYAAAGVAGLVLTKWGALRLVEPRAASRGAGDRFWLAAAIATLAVLGYLAYRAVAA